MEQIGTWTQHIAYVVCCVPLVTNICLISASQKYGQDLINHIWDLITWNAAGRKLTDVIVCLWFQV